MKKRDSRLRIRIFYGMLIIPTLLWLVLSVIGIGKFLDYDTGEKRNKHEIAEDANLSNITAELESVYNDRVPFRSIMLSVNSTINWLTELPYTKVIEPVLLKIANASISKDAGQSGQTASAGDGTTDPNVGDPNAVDSNGVAADPNAQAAGQNAVDPNAADPNAQSVDPNAVDPNAQSNTLAILPAIYESPIESGYYPYKELSKEVIQGRDGWLFTTESYKDFIGETMPSEETLARKLSELDQLNQICQSKGIELYTFIMPNKNVVYPEYMPSVDQVEYSGLNALEDYIHANSGINFQYFDDEMLGAKAYGRLYYMHDTHWNNRGGLAAYAYMRNTLGLSPIDLSTIGIVEGEEKIGDLAQYTGLPEASFETEYTFDMQYKWEVPQTMVRGGDDYIDELISENTESDKTLVLIGDSYRHSLIPYISRDFAHVYSLNEKLLSDEMIDILNSADIIILEGVERNVFFEVHYDNAVEGMVSLMGTGTQ